MKGDGDDCNLQQCMASKDIRLITIHSFGDAIFQGDAPS